MFNVIIRDQLYFVWNESSHNMDEYSKSKGSTIKLIKLHKLIQLPSDLLAIKLSIIM